MKSIILLLIFCTSNVYLQKADWVNLDDSSRHVRGSLSSFNRKSVQEENENNENNYKYVRPEKINPVFENTANNERDVTLIISYYKRLINIIINSIQLNKKDDVSPFEENLLRLITTVSQEQMAILENFGRNLDEYNANSLREVDTVLQDILTAAQKRSVKEIVFDWSYLIVAMISSTQNIIVAAVVILIYMTYSLIYKNFSIIRALSLFIFFTFILGFGWTWYDLIEEEEIKLMAERMQYPIPPECNALELTFWQRWLSNSGTDCHKFLRAHHRKAFLAVTPQKVLSEMFGDSLRHILNHLSKSLSYFFVEMHGALPFPLNYLAFPFLLLFILLIFMQILVVTTRMTFRMNLLYSLFHVEIGQGGRRIENRYNRIDDVNNNEDERRQLEANRNIRPAIQNINNDLDVQNAAQEDQLERNQLEENRNDEPIIQIENSSVQVQSEEKTNNDSDTQNKTSTSPNTQDWLVQDVNNEKNTEFFSEEHDNSVGKNDIQNCNENSREFVEVLKTPTPFFNDKLESGALSESKTNQNNTDPDEVFKNPEFVKETKNCEDKIKNDPATDLKRDSSNCLNDYKKPE